MRIVIRTAIACVVAASTASVVVWTCGLFSANVVTVARVYPAYAEEYARGQLGVVRPTYSRRSLLHAYRMLSGLPPNPAIVAPSLRTSDISVYSESSTWMRAAAAALGIADLPDAYLNRGFHRRVPGTEYEGFSNCLADAFTSATRTLADRVGKYGPQHPLIRDWVMAQIEVFKNCRDNSLSLPLPVASGADALARADRAYQTAAAYFYAMDYDEAARRFALIATDSSSPWRKYGRYLVARARLRQAVFVTASRDEHFALADKELQAVLADATASELHASVRGLRDYLRGARDPVARLHDVTVAVVSSASPKPQDLIDYEHFFDKVVDPATQYSYEAVRDRAAIRRVDDVNDWVLALQGQGPEATARALARWRETRSLPWLVAALWKAPRDSAAIDAILDAASRVSPDVPGFLTVAVARARLLVQLGRRDDARAVLTQLPSDPVEGVDAETVNLIKALRLQVANSFEEFLVNAPRQSLDDRALAVFDHDAGELFTHQLPLDRLVEAAVSTTLPARLRARVAGAALSRAIVMRKPDAGVRAARALRAVGSAATHADLDRYINAAPEDERHRMALLLLARTPGLHAFVQGLEDDAHVAVADPNRKVDTTFRRNWWCTGDGRINFRDTKPSSLMPLLYGQRRPSAADFLESGEAQKAAQETQQLIAFGSAHTWLAREAIALAKRRPNDLDIAEILAHVVEGGRWTRCSGAETDSASERAFETLHKMYPKSEWARRTRYWWRSMG